MGFASYIIVNSREEIIPTIKNHIIEHGVKEDRKTAILDIEPFKNSGDAVNFFIKCDYIDFDHYDIVIPFCEFEDSAVKWMIKTKTDIHKLIPESFLK